MIEYAKVTGVNLSGPTPEDPLAKVEKRRADEKAKELDDKRREAEMAAQRRIDQLASEAEHMARVEARNKKRKEKEQEAQRVEAEKLRISADRKEAKKLKAQALARQAKLAAQEKRTRARIAAELEETDPDAARDHRENEDMLRRAAAMSSVFVKTEDN